MVLGQLKESRCNAIVLDLRREPGGVLAAVYRSPRRLSANFPDGFRNQGRKGVYEQARPDYDEPIRLKPTYEVSAIHPIVALEGRYRLDKAFATVHKLNNVHRVMDAFECWYRLLHFDRHIIYSVRLYP